MNALNSIQWTPRAARQLRKLARHIQIEIRDAVTAKLPRFPRCSGVKALTSHAHSYRLRVGNHRVFFEFDGAIKRVTIEEVKKRDERTY
jgi:mRNA-degrading endonuclease RelE of RelBE toxin-antitoxin system